MFLRFTKFSRPVYGLIIALIMLFAPALIVTTVESAPQKTKVKPTPPTKKKATPEQKKTQAKTKATPTPSKSKTNTKNSKETASKNKTADKRNDRNSAKNDKKTSDKDKNSKNERSSKNSKQNLAAKNSIPSKSAKNERNSKTDKNAKTNDKTKNTSSKNSKTATTEKSRSTSKTTKKSTVAKTTPKPVNTKSKTGNTNRTTDEPAETTTTTTESPQIIVTTYSVPLRSQAKSDAATVSNVKLGTVLKVTEKNPAWYKVQYSTGGKSTTGWISANAVNDLNAAGKTEIYRQIVERNYKPQMDFESASEFYEFTSKVGGELDNSDKSAEIELKRLLALRSALKTIPSDKRENAPYKDFLKSQEKEIVYNEPAGQWLVTSNQFWNLHDKYKKTSVSDTIAWEAANNPLPGECEGYVNCYLFDMRMRFGEYLNLHPNGKNASEALKNMTDYLSPIVADSQAKTIYNGPTDVTDRAEFNNLIAELRTIVARLPFVEKEKALQQLRTIAEAYR